VNAVFFNKIQAIEAGAEREAYVAERRREYERDIELLHLASENIVDAVVQPDGSPRSDRPGGPHVRRHDGGWVQQPGSLKLAIRVCHPAGDEFCPSSV